MEPKTIEEEFELMMKFVKVFNPENKPQSVGIEFDNFGSLGIQKTYSLYIERTANTVKAKSLSSAMKHFIWDLERPKDKPEIEEEGKEE